MISWNWLRRLFGKSGGKDAPFKKGDIVKVSPRMDASTARFIGLELDRTYEVYSLKKFGSCSSGWLVDTDALISGVDSSWFVKVR